MGRMQAIQDRNPRTLRLVLIGLVIVVLLCVVGALIYNILTSEPDDVAQVDTPTPTAESTEELIPASDEPTATPTRVISDTTPEPTEESTEEATAEPTTEPTVQPTTVSSGVTQPGDNGTTTVTMVEEGPIQNVLKNGGFETFNEWGVATDWGTFKSDNIIAVYSAESPGPYVDSGSKAQRITTSQATVGDRYVGLYQQVNVVPDQPYALEMKGQIRTGFGDVNKSSFGYRMQYAVSQRAMRNWEMVPQEDWIELPWDEQLLHSPDTQFLEYTTEIIPTSEQITLFIRAWNKWADPGEAQFTIDSFSLTGPSVIERTMTMATGDTTEAGTSTTSTTGSDSTMGSEDAMVDKGLPITGAGEGESLVADGRFWGALMVLLLLALGAVYRAKWVH